MKPRLHRRVRWTITMTVGAALLALSSSLISSPPVSAQDDPALLRELAVRLLDQQYSYNQSVTAQERVQLMPGRLPDNPWFTLATPPGGRLIGSMVRPAGTQVTGGPGQSASRESVSVVFDAPGPVTAVETYFSQAILALGWKPAPVSYGSPGGFQQVRTPRSQMFCQTTGPSADANEMGPSMTLTVSPGTSGSNDVRLSTGSSGPPCWTPTLPSTAFSMPYSSPSTRTTTLIPSLTAPEDVQLQSTGGGGGMGSYSSEARATTTRSVNELSAIFSPQLEAAGWVQIEQGGGDAVVWGTWRVPSAEEEQFGMLLVVRTPGDDHRQLSVRVYSASTDTGYYGGYGTYGSGYFNSSPYAPSESP